MATESQKVAICPRVSTDNQHAESMENQAR